VHDARIDHARAEFSVDHADLNRVLGHLVSLDVRALTTSPPTLEELFLRHYEDSPDRHVDTERDLAPSTPGELLSAPEAAASMSDAAVSTNDAAPSTPDLELVR
jgi:hypothetical protein